MMSRTNLPRNRAKSGTAGRATPFCGIIARPGIVPPVSMSPLPNFSNGRLNFKHLFWAAQRPEKGIFAAFAEFLTRACDLAEAARDPLADRLRQPFNRG